MPIAIRQHCETETKPVAWLCDDSWDLRTQVAVLETWLNDSANSLPCSNYSIDIGFDIRPGAAGGSASFSPQSLALMGKLGMSLDLSEYDQGLNQD